MSTPENIGNTEHPSSPEGPKSSVNPEGPEGADTPIALGAPSALGVHYRPAPHFLTLGPGYADAVDAAHFPSAQLRYRNQAAAGSIGLAGLTDAAWVEHFGRFKPLADNLPAPLAQRYHGHQFRSYNPQIGDGRGFLFAQMLETQPEGAQPSGSSASALPRTPRLMDLGTKGSGTTPYSRAGDGRLTLKGAVREILASEMLYAHGANSSRTLSVIETGEALHRADEPSPARSAVMVRLTHSHIRIGTFQYHAYHRDHDRLLALAHYVLKHYYSDDCPTPPTSTPNLVNTLLSLVGRSIAKQAADLMTSGFVHGVLNTDNINLTGEIFDFGPWRFLPKMNMQFTAAYFDSTGLYAYGRQAEALQWNLYQLAACFLDICDEESMRRTLEPFSDWYQTAFRSALLARLNLTPTNNAEDDALLSSVSQFLMESDVGFEDFFFDWFGGSEAAHTAQNGPRADYYKASDTARQATSLLSARASRTAQPRSHAYFQESAPCTMLIEDVESIWARISEHDDWSALHAKLAHIKTMQEALRPSRTAL